MLFLECDFQMIPSPLEDDWNRKLSGSFLLELKLIGFEIEIGLCNCESGTVDLRIYSDQVKRSLFLTLQTFIHQQTEKYQQSSY